MQLVRTRDVIVLVADQTIPVMIDSAMASGGWPGGQGITWAATVTDNFVGTYSDGTYGGFALWGSNEPSDQLISYTGNQPLYRFAVVCVGTWVIATSSFEQYTLESRLVPPLVPNVYVPGNRVRFSLRGLFTPQDEWTISGDPRAPNGFLVGSVIQAPGPENSNYLMVQTTL